MKESELVIIGAGPGGLAAAIEAVRAGVNVTVLDENPKVGGQIYRQFDKGFKVKSPEILGREYGRGEEFLRDFSSLGDNVQYLNEAMVWGIFGSDNLSFEHNNKSSSLGFKKLIVAAGAYDRPVPFPGWTLPGVFTAGGAQRLIKMQRVLPGEKILLAGTGPMQLVLAEQILNAGGKIEGILEAGRIKYGLKSIAGIFGNWDLLADAWHYWRCIRRAGVPLWRNHIILEARGEAQVEEAVIAEVDRNWRPKPNTRRTLKVDTICSGYGFVPSSEITKLAGCDHMYEPHLGGWVPVRGKNMETTVPGIYAVGDGAGVAGSKVAINEGRIAGISIAHALGYIPAEDARGRIMPIQKGLKRINRLRKVLDEISRPRPGLYELARNDTVICRCEEVTFEAIQEAIKEDTNNDINDIKRMTRIGMGRCQGRMCMPVLLEIMGRHQGPNFAGYGSLRPRPPVKPVSLEVLAGNPEQE